MSRVIGCAFCECDIEGMHRYLDCPNHPDNTERPDAAPREDEHALYRRMADVLQPILLDCASHEPLTDEALLQTAQQLHENGIVANAAPPPSDAAPVAWRSMARSIYDKQCNNIRFWSVSTKHHADDNEVFVTEPLYAHSAPRPDKEPHPTVPDGSRSGQVEDALGGPWEIKLQEGNWWSVTKGGMVITLFVKSEAIAVRDALNRLKGETNG